MRVAGRGWHRRDPRSIRFLDRGVGFVRGRCHGLRSSGARAGSSPCRTRIVLSGSALAMNPGPTRVQRSEWVGRSGPAELLERLSTAVSTAWTTGAQAPSFGHRQSEPSSRRASSCARIVARNTLGACSTSACDAIDKRGKPVHDPDCARRDHAAVVVKVKSAAGPDPTSRWPSLSVRTAPICRLTSPAPRAYTPQPVRVPHQSTTRWRAATDEQDAPLRAHDRARWRR
jgi:hypothetical protein